MRISRRRRRVARRSASLPSGSGRWLLVIIGAEAGVALSIRVPLLFGRQAWPGFPALSWIPEFVALLLVPLVGCAAWLVRRQHRERSQAARTARLLDTALIMGREWLWATGPDGRFTFSGPACRDLTGYEPSELLGRHFSLVIERDDLDAALRDRPGREASDGVWSGLVTVCRHKDGTPVIVEVSGRPLRDRAGRESGFEGMTRPLNAAAAEDLAFGDIRSRVEAMLTERTLLTAFQPIRSLVTGEVIGAEALTRFLSSPGISPEVWFAEAASVGLGVELEILALQTALDTAASLPSSVYIAVNVSPLACLDQRLRTVLEESRIPVRRLVLEVTERHQVNDYGTLAAALLPLRRAGVRIAVDDAGAGFASMRHILQLRPDLIKLDRDIIAGIDSDPAQRALGTAMAGFAAQTGAVLVAEGIETLGELDTVTSLGMAAGQGYLLGRPSVRPQEWTHWPATPPPAGRTRHAGETAGS